jgi:hypothetical protein
MLNSLLLRIHEFGTTSEFEKESSVAIAKTWAGAVIMKKVRRMFPSRPLEICTCNIKFREYALKTKRKINDKKIGESLFPFGE